MNPRIDVDEVRAATPGCGDHAFLLSAGSSLPTQRTLDAVIGHLHREATIGGYGAADEVEGLLAKGRSDLATLIGGKATEVAFATSDSAGWIKAWWGWVIGGNIARGSTVLVDRLSYHSHYAALVQTQALAGFVIEELPSLPDGTVDLTAAVIGDNVSVVCLTMIGTHSGNVNPVSAVGAMAQAAGVPMFVDGCQALGQLQVDVRALGCQVFTGTGRKWLRAPRGTGLLWVAEEIVSRFQPPGIDGTSTDWSAAAGISVHPGGGRFEEFETSVASRVGLATAAAEAVALGMDAIESRVRTLADQLRVELSNIGGVTVHDTAADRCAIVTFSVAAVEPAQVVRTAADHGVSVNVSSANWAALDMHAKGLASVVRASPHYFNTEDELGRLIAAVQASTTGAR
jgi:cysteine desulfurase / selenocysteine lyase